MNERQRRFCEFFAGCGNAAEAARKAGYSARTARSQGQRLLTDVDIQHYIRSLQEQAAEQRIASMIQVRAFWSDVLNSQEERTADRLRAGELLARTSGEFVNQPKAPAIERSADADSSETAPDQQILAKIVLPWNGRSPFNAVETDSGEIVPLSGYESEDVLTYLPYKITGGRQNAAPCREALMVNDRWSDLATLRRDHDTALRLLDQQGLIRCIDPHWTAEAKRLFLPIVVALQSVIMGSLLSLVYCYDQQQQPPHIAKNDGYSSVSERQADGRRVASIGVSVQAIQQGDAYATMIFLHELAHILRSYPVEHGREFHRTLDGLIARYNAATGAQIENDYFGLWARPESAQKAV